MRAIHRWARLRDGLRIEASVKARRSFDGSLGYAAFAICLSGSGEPVGSISLVRPRCDATQLGPDYEFEVSYWIARPLWGQGMTLEAVGAMQRYAFETLGCEALWCGCREDNDGSRRVQRRCGFVPRHVEHDVTCGLLGDICTECYSRLTREERYKRRDAER